MLAGAAALVALALAAGTATAAHADSFRHQDATGDVVVTTTSSPGASGVESWGTPDLQNLTVLHSRWTLSVATAVRGLGGNDNWTATIVTSKGDRFQVTRAELLGVPPTSTVSVRVFRNGHSFSCDGLAVSRTSSGVITKVPTRCLGNPWKVRVGVMTHAVYGDDAVERRGHDDVLRNGAFTYYRPALSPWIAR